MANAPSIPWNPYGDVACYGDTGYNIPMETRGKPVEVLAYTAGIVDGEGHIGLSKSMPKPEWRGRSKTPRYEYSVTVVNTDHDLVKWLHAEFGGSYQVRPPQKVDWLSQSRWVVSSFQAAAFCEMILPYLRIKRQQAELLVQYMREKAPKPTGHGVRVTEEELAWRESMHQRMMELNHNISWRRRPQRLTGSAPQLDVNEVGEVIVWPNGKPLEVGGTETTYPLIYERGTE